MQSSPRQLVSNLESWPAGSASSTPPPTLADDKPSLRILGEVVEKPRRPLERASPTGQQDTAPREAFPKATHRRASKFSLARKANSQQHGLSSCETKGSDGVTGPGVNEARNRVQGEHTPAPSAARPIPSTEAEPTNPEEEKAAVQTIMKENDAFISKLTVTEVRLHTIHSGIHSGITMLDATECLPPAG